jgi:hypothetical protein
MEKPVGASTCVVNNQEYKGHIGILQPKPTNIKKNKKLDSIYVKLKLIMEVKLVELVIVTI